MGRSLHTAGAVRGWERREAEADCSVWACRPGSHAVAQLVVDAAERHHEGLLHRQRVRIVQRKGVVPRAAKLAQHRPLRLRAAGLQARQLEVLHGGLGDAAPEVEAVALNRVVPHGLEVAQHAHPAAPLAARLARLGRLVLLHQAALVARAHGAGGGQHHAHAARPAALADHRLLVAHRHQLAAGVVLTVAVAAMAAQVAVLAANVICHILRADVVGAQLGVEAL
mmetsp:Transcript_15653/g.39797  ORF Transcript_15653/g.39797 Transcript_15653/m.39797 type:complete len:225 (+) Transcript_15653:288-962(+)